MVHYDARHIRKLLRRTQPELGGTHDPVDRPCDPGAFRAPGSPAHDPLRARRPSRTSTLDRSRIAEPWSTRHGWQGTVSAANSWARRMRSAVLPRTLEYDQRPSMARPARRTVAPAPGGCSSMTGDIHHETRLDGDDDDRGGHRHHGPRSALGKCHSRFRRRAASRMPRRRAGRMTGETFTYPLTQGASSMIGSTGSSRAGRGVPGDMRDAGPVFGRVRAPWEALGRRAVHDWPLTSNQRRGPRGAELSQENSARRLCSQTQLKRRIAAATNRALPLDPLPRRGG